jgi:hypothetical protein
MPKEGIVVAPANSPRVGQPGALAGIAGKAALNLRLLAAGIRPAASLQTVDQVRLPVSLARLPVRARAGQGEGPP